jgi:hypothetical protein
MLNSGDLVAGIFSLARIAAVLLALWLAFRYVPRVLAILEHNQETSQSHAARAVIWFALGALVAIPLTDVVGFIRTLVEIVSPATWGLLNGTVSTSWGSLANRVFVALSGGTTFAIYAGTSVLLWRRLGVQASPNLNAFAQSKMDRILITGSIAGLVNLVVISILVGAMFVRLPFSAAPLELGTPRLVAAWLLALVLVVVVAGAFNLRAQPSLHED